MLSSPTATPVARADSGVPAGPSAFADLLLQRLSRAPAQLVAAPDAGLLPECAVLPDRRLVADPAPLPQAHSLLDRRPRADNLSGSQPAVLSDDRVGSHLDAGAQLRRRVDACSTSPTAIVRKVPSSERFSPIAESSIRNGAIMRPTEFSADTIIALLRKQTIATLPEVMAALGPRASKAHRVSQAQGPRRPDQLLASRRLLHPRRTRPLRRARPVVLRRGSASPAPAP